MNIYFGIKYVADFSNRPLIEHILNLLEAHGHETYCVVRDMEAWGERQYSPQRLMQETFERIGQADVVLIEFSEKGTGLGMEAGYGYAKDKPILVIAREAAEISTTMQGIAAEIILYPTIEQLEQKLAEALERQAVKQ